MVVSEAYISELTAIHNEPFVEPSEIAPMQEVGMDYFHNKGQ
jgi:hypothetical protein